MDSHATAQPLRQSLNPLNVWVLVASRRELIASLTRQELALLFNESFLGALWVAVQPLLSLAVYTFVFTVIFQPRAEPGTEPLAFVLRLFCGIVLYWLFAQTVARAPMLIVSRPNFVKSVVFPLEVLPVVALGVAGVYFLCGMAILLVAAALVQGTVHATALLLPLVLLPLVCLTLGVSWFLASLGVFIRDIQPGVQFVLQLVFFLTPIVWSLDVVPEAFRPWLALNPLATVIESARAVVLAGEAPAWGALAAVTAGSVGVMVLGHAWFVRTREGFADVL